MGKKTEYAWSCSWGDTSGSEPSIQEAIQAKRDHEAQCAFNPKLWIAEDMFNDKRRKR